MNENSNWSNSIHLSYNIIMDTAEMGSGDVYLSALEF